MQIFPESSIGQEYCFRLSEDRKECEFCFIEKFNWYINKFFSHFKSLRGPYNYTDSRGAMIWFFKDGSYDDYDSFINPSLIQKLNSNKCFSCRFGTNPVKFNEL